MSNAWLNMIYSPTDLHNKITHTIIPYLDMVAGCRILPCLCTCTGVVSCKCMYMYIHVALYLNHVHYRIP